jgi:hypothetical protein
MARGAVALGGPGDSSGEGGTGSLKDAPRCTRDSVGKGHLRLFFQRLKKSCNATTAELVPCWLVLASYLVLVVPMLMFQCSTSSVEHFQTKAVLLDY